MAAVSTESTGGEKRSVDALSAGPGLFDVLRVRPALGRALEPADSRPGAAPVVVLGARLWRDLFAADPHVVGRGIKIGDDTRQVVGVAPDGFRFPPGSASDVILPLTVPLEAPTERKSTWMFAVGRLAPSHSLAQATADLSRIAAQMGHEHPESNEGSDYYAVSLRDNVVGDTGKALVLLLGAVGVVMLIACANVANLMLARGLARRGEMAIRAALGASRGRIVAQLLFESLVLALAAACLSILAAQWVTHAIVALVPRSIAVFGLAEAGLDPGTIGFAVGAAILAALVLAAASSVVAGGDGASPMIASTRTSTSASARRLGSAIVIAEVALSIVLLFAVGLIGKSFARLLAVDPGFRVDEVTTMDVQVARSRYATPETARALFDRVLPAIAALPGVRQAGAAVVTPLTGNNWTVGLERADRPLPAGERPPEVGWQLASRGYFEVLQIPLREGRLFEKGDTPASRPVVIVSQAVERRFFPGERAVGHILKVGDAQAEIVGVVGDIRRADLRDDPRQDMYFPFEQRPALMPTLFLKTSGNGVSLAAVASALRPIDPDLQTGEPTRMEDVLRDSVQIPRLVLTLLSGFAAMALLLAAVGIYGVMSYVVRQRTREIGTRMALGATGGQIAWLVMRGGALIAVAGTAIGIAVSLAGSRVLSSILFATSPVDPAAMAATALVLVLTTLAACAVPARRAARVDPARSLADQ
jgi:predicted permease